VHERRAFLCGVTGTAVACLGGCLGGGGGGGSGDPGTFPVLSEPTLAEYAMEGQDESTGRIDAAELGYTDHASLSDQETHLPDAYANRLGDPPPNSRTGRAGSTFESIDTVGAGFVETRRYGGDGIELVGLASGRVELTTGAYDPSGFREAMSLGATPDEQYDGYDVHYTSEDGDEQSGGFALGDGTLLYGSGHASLPRYLVDRAEGGSPASWIRNAIGRAEPFDIGVLSYHRTSGSVEQSTGLGLVAFEVEGERTTYKWVEAAPNDGGFRASWDEARLRERYEGREIDDLTIETNGTHGILQGTIDTSVIESFD